MWEDLMKLCSQKIGTSGGQQLLTELIRIDVKSRADPRQIRNIDFAKRLKQTDVSVKECMSSAEKSITTASKLKQFAVFPKTFLQLLKVMSASKSKKSLPGLKMVLKAVKALEDLDLLKLGKDLANLLALCIEDSGYDLEVREVLRRVGIQDNDLVLLCLSHKELILMEPKLL